MKELAVRFQVDNPDAIFVSWVKEIREFCAVDLAQTLSGQSNGIAYIPVAGTSDGAEAKQPESASTQRAVLKQGAIRIAKGLLRRSSRFVPSLSQRVENKLIYMRLSQLPVVAFKEQDRLFIPWGEWWDPNFIDKLEVLHQAQVRLIQILHDMSPIVVPQFSNSGNAVETYPTYCRRIFPICSLILSVSENSKNDALKWLEEQKLDVPPIRVFRLGDSIEIAKPTPSTDPAFEQSGLKGRDFILFVGTIELKKNHQLLYYVYKLAKIRGIVLPPLVIVGRRGWMTEATFELMTQDPEVRDSFIFLLNTSDEELSWLYDKCLFTVLPSFYEGWGIPIAESVARGVPCLCSNTSSMNEIAEGYVEHFSPLSTDECLAGMERWLRRETLETARAKAKQYQPFTWDESFKKVQAYVKEIR
jgi:hypothetical protein